MKYVLSIVTLAFFFFSADAQRVKRKGVTPIMKNAKQAQQQANFTIDQFQGKWQETGRKTRKGKALAFTDTIYLNFYENDKVDTRQGNNPNVNGAAEIDVDNSLLAAADVYTIKSVNASTIVLDDNDKFVHTFKKTDSFWLEKVGRTVVPIDTFKTVVKVDINNLMGDWLVYKRQAKPGEVKTPAMLIKYLKIKNKTGENTATGFVTIYQKDKAEELACTITVHKTGMQLTAGTYSWYLPIYKADGKELVFGNVELMLNFCKPL
ncbi:MAG: hypothetical protein V4556_05170 [Bacteroidota bacterium]